MEEEAEKVSALEKGEARAVESVEEKVAEKVGYSVERIGKDEKGVKEMKMADSVEDPAENAVAMG